VAELRRILLYGDSIILGSVGASLELVPHFEVTHLSPPLPGASELEPMDPDIIVFDVDGDVAAGAFSLLETRPGLLILGISPDGNLVRLWSGHQYRELSTEELTALIEAAPRGDAAACERPTTTHCRAVEA
jgi:hypothetical protein